MRVRVATFNVENLDDRPGLVPSLAERIGVLRPQLVALRADVLCLQEVHGQKVDKHLPRQLRALDELLETTEYAGFHRASTLAHDHGSIDVHNLVVLSRFRIASHEQVRHDVVRGPIYQQVTASPPAAAARVEWDRPLLVVTLDLGEEHPPLHVINVHMRAPLAALIEGQKASQFVWKTTNGWAEGYFLAEMKRAGQALEARLIVDRILDADPGAFIVVAGDFNAEGREGPLRLLCADPEDTGNAALGPRSLVPLEQAAPEGTRFTVLHHGRKQMLDHVLVSRSLEGRARGAEIANAALEDEFTAYVAGSHPAGSFHAPVVVEMELSVT